MNKPDLKDIKQAYITADLLYSESEVNHAIRQMGISISEARHDRNPIILCVMNGGLVTTGKLLTELNFPLEVDYVHASRYRNTTYGQTLEWKAAPHIDLNGRSVLIVDDILDEGHTLAAIIEYCQAKGATETFMAVLINKDHNRKAMPDLIPDFIGLEVEDRYVFGFGMDYCGYWRNAPGIFALKEPKNNVSEAETTP